MLTEETQGVGQFGGAMKESEEHILLYRRVLLSDELVEDVLQLITGRAGSNIKLFGQ